MHQNSKLSLILRLFKEFTHRPIYFLKKLTFKRIINFFTSIKSDNASLLVDDFLKRPDERYFEVKYEDLKINRQLRDYEILRFPKFPNPLVSIIIPVYNEFEYTYNCLKSILLNSGEISYEIIVANDCSTDLTTQIESIVYNGKIINNESNLRFLNNCNNAAKSAIGKYILFLNNDTYVQDNWLSPLIDLMQSDEKIGLVGSKLIYPDGLLQEAGGILWKDGSAWNYGNRCDANRPEYNYVKETDYISGASIMIRSDLWNEIGGFDERFSPAYCEDSDLAFEVRSHGYKVMYQPKSVVVHFEGVSNGTDTSQGQKAYQIINQKKLYQKWKNVLRKEHFYVGENLFSARDRSSSKKTLLMIDYFVPHYDKDAGSRTVFQYLKLFVKMGFNVKYIGDTFCPDEPYTSVLEQLGIEVLYGGYYFEHWQDWLSKNKDRINFIFLNHPDISIKYMDYIRKKTTAKIIYYGHDLQFLRLYREYELTGNNNILNLSEEWKAKELYLMRAANIVYYPSCCEINEIAKLDAKINAKVIPAYLFDNIIEQPYDFENRKDIMFVGGFNHIPNIDAVEWLSAEIMPLLLEKNPDIRINVLGSNPTEKVLKLNSNSLRIAGFVTDEQLIKYYHQSRISIAPLRYGAGIKGKVIEAMYYGIPVITTSIGAEGIENAEDILTIADDAQTFAEMILSLYDDEKILSEISKASYNYIKQNFTSENALKIISGDFQ